jgi:energy-coupling factor transporter transmembrane protein EcfT
MLTVPAIVLATRRAWAITEAASARGFEAPHRRSYHSLQMRAKDWILSLGTLGIIALLIWI